MFFHDEAAIEKGGTDQARHGTQGRLTPTLTTISSRPLDIVCPSDRFEPLTLSYSCDVSES